MFPPPQEVVTILKKYKILTEKEALKKVFIFHPQNLRNLDTSFPALLVALIPL